MSSASLAEHASRQASSIEETNASLEELSGVTRETSEHASAAKTAANRARTIAEKGASEVALMNEAMMDIRSSSNNIANIIKSIDEIAFQTNILALNAAVEAARAGEAGAGFAVVADEVRNLAQRSAQAAQETAEKIEDSVSRSERGAEISTRVSTQLEEIFSITQDVDELIAKIADASTEQNSGITQISAATREIDRATQDSVARSEENARASQYLNELSEELSESVQTIDSILGIKPNTREDDSSSGRAHIHEMDKEFSSRTNEVPAVPVNEDVVNWN